MSREDGFTLVEVMAGLVLGSILLASIFGVFLTGYASVRVSQDTMVGDQDVQLTLTYLQTDIHGSSRDPALLTVTNGGNTLALGVPDPSGSGRFLTVTYAYTSGGSPTVGTLTRTVTDATGAVVGTTAVARNLKPGLTSVFAATCTPGCTSVTATLQFLLNGNTVTRNIQATPQLAFP